MAEIYVNQCFNIGLFMKVIWVHKDVLNALVPYKVFYTYRIVTLYFYRLVINPLKDQVPLYQCVVFFYIVLKYFFLVVYI